METSTPIHINRKWLICTVLSLIGLLLLSRRLGQAPRPANNLVRSFDIGQAQSPTSITLFNSTSDSSANSGLAETLPPLPSIGLPQNPSKVAFADLLSTKPNYSEVGASYSSIDLSQNHSDFAFFDLLSTVQNHREVAASNSSIGLPQDHSEVALFDLVSTKQNHSEAAASNSSISIASTWSKSSPKSEAVHGSEEHCDITNGRWVYDPKTYPLYKAERCPFLSDQVLCLKNGRPDTDYQHWRWEPTSCKLPKFDGNLLLKRLKGKRVAIIGDSLNRNEFESLCCLLYSSLRRPSRSSFRSYSADYKIFRARDYRLAVEFYQIPFLVTMFEAGDGKKVVKLDGISDTAARWRGANVMVFNTGHWWTHRTGYIRAYDYFEYRGKLVEMTVDAAYEVGLKTWARWIDRNVDPAKTLVFFRSIAPLHNPASKQWCYNQTSPITNETYIQWFPRSMISKVEKTIKEMKTPIRYLNITRLTEYRRDGHTSVYTSRRGKLLTTKQRKQPRSYADCSHWCLPGVPDTWNLLLYNYIIGTSPSLL